MSTAEYAAAPLSVEEVDDLFCPGAPEWAMGAEKHTLVESRPHDGPSWGDVVRDGEAIGSWYYDPGSGTEWCEGCLTGDGMYYPGGSGDDICHSDAADSPHTLRFSDPERQADYDRRSDEAVEKARADALAAAEGLHLIEINRYRNHSGDGFGNAWYIRECESAAEKVAALTEGLAHHSRVSSDTREPLKTILGVREPDEDQVVRAYWQADFSCPFGVEMA